MSRTLKVKVRLFAHLRELAGADRLEVEVEDGCKVRELLLRLSNLMPQAFRGVVRPQGELMDGYSVLVNARRAELDEELTTGSEVAILPPVGGGLQVVWVDRGHLNAGPAPRFQEALNDDRLIAAGATHS